MFNITTTTTSNTTATTTMFSTTTTTTSNAIATTTMFNTTTTTTSNTATTTMFNTTTTTTSNATATTTMFNTTITTTSNAATTYTFNTTTIDARQVMSLLLFLLSQNKHPVCLMNLQAYVIVEDTILNTNQIIKFDTKQNKSNLLFYQKISSSVVIFYRHLFFPTQDMISHLACQTGIHTATVNHVFHAKCVAMINTDLDAKTHCIKIKNTKLMYAFHFNDLLKQSNHHFKEH